MPHMRKTLFSLGALLTMAGALMLYGCAGTEGQATTDDVDNKAFTFTNGAVFHAALTNVATTLQFFNKAGNFTLSSAGGTTTGNNRFGSCILTVTSSSYPIGNGPQVNDVITLSTCDFDSTNRALTVSNGPISATSSPAIARLANATAADLNDNAYLFASGAVFHPALVNVVTTLEFTNNATTFTLFSSDATTTSTATGATTLTSGSCTLAITSSTYTISTGPIANTVITLNPCQFDSTTGLLIISNGPVTISSI